MIAGGSRLQPERVVRVPETQLQRSVDDAAGGTPALPGDRAKGSLQFEGTCSRLWSGAHPHFRDFLTEIVGPFTQPCGFQPAIFGAVQLLGADLLLDLQFGRIGRADHHEGLGRAGGDGGDRAGF